MLLDNQKRSKGRVWGGTAATAAIGLTALCLTASGTHAAETVRTTVEDRIGVRLAEVTLPSFASLAKQAAPAAPAPVERPEAPTPPEPEADRGDMQVYRSRDGDRTIVLRRGRANDDDSEIDRIVARTEATRIDTERMVADIERRTPQVIERKCGPGAGNSQDFMTEEMDGERRRITICTDRIERMAADASERGGRAQVLAMSSARMGKGMARMSLNHARRAIEAQPDMTPEQRAHALAGIDQAMAELEPDMDD